VRSACHVPRGLALFATVVLVSCRAQQQPPKGSEERFLLSELLGKGGTSAGFERASTPRRFDFPRDHGPHPSFRAEWWYVTGNLLDPSGRRFGYQLTIFRSALSPTNSARPSDWGATQIYMGNFAVTDVGDGHFDAFDRFERGAVGLAGASGNPLRVWIDNWSIASIGSDAFPIRIEAQEGTLAIELLAREGIPPVLQGDRGLSQKGPEAGDASYYYSLPRMPTQGTVRIGDRTYRVEGLSWLDREWSTSSLGRNQVGWDWFGLQLSDGRQLMYYQLRQADGRRDPLSAGTLIGADGRAIALSDQQVQLEVTSHWRSPKDGSSYPSGWKLRVPSAQLSLEIRPYLSNQELNLAIRYWEGAVGLTGTVERQAVTGSGYAELTGYAN
jgi:predicted secreted hydrolase